MTRRSVLLLGLLACAPKGPSVEVQGAYAFEPVLGQVGAVYFTVENHAGTPDTLVGLDIAGAERAMIHEPVQMRPVATLPVPAHGMLTLKPGGYHVMVDGMAHPLVAGDTLDMGVRFAHAGTVQVRVPVRAYGAEP